MRSIPAADTKLPTARKKKKHLLPFDHNAMKMDKTWKRQLPATIPGHVKDFLHQKVKNEGLAVLPEKNRDLCL